MSEYIIGDRIEPSAQPYTLTEREFTEAVGIRVYGTESGTGGSYSDGTYIEFVTSNSGAGNTYAYRWDGEPLYDGYIDIFEVMLRSDLSITEAIKDIITATGAGGTALVGNAGRGTLAPFSFIYEGGTHMTTVTERIAKITVSGNETVKFNPVYPVIAIKGDNIDATLIKDIAADATEGVYSTSDGDGYTIIDNHACKDTLYLSGTGDVRIWGGTDANKCPFTSDITGGEEQPWQPLEDGYSNFWFELTDDTLSPWLNFSAKNNDAVIDWGDGSGEVALDTLTPTHTYSKAGKYVVKVKGVTGIDAQHTAPYNSKYMAVLKNVELNSEVSQVATYCFRYCTALKNLDIQHTSLTQAYIAFSFCPSLQTAILPNGIEALTSSFFNDLSLTNINLPSNLTQLSAAFYTCVSLQRIDIPAAVESIGNNTFNVCSSLSEIHIRATVPPTLGTNTFAALPSNYIIYVPIGYGETYKAASGWSTYADHILEEGTRMSASQLRKIQNEIKTEGEEKI